MLRNLSDYLSLFTLIFISIYALHFVMLSFIDRESDVNNDHSLRAELLKDYINNEEE